MNGPNGVTASTSIAEISFWHWAEVFSLVTMFTNLQQLVRLNGGKVRVNKKDTFMSIIGIRYQLTPLVQIAILDYRHEPAFSSIATSMDG